MSFSLGYIQSRSRVGWALSSGGCAVRIHLQLSLSSARFSSVQFSYSLLCFCFSFSFCFIFIVLPHSTRLPFFPLYRLALYLNRLELSRLVVPLSPPSLSPSLSLSPSRCLCPCFRVLSPPHPAPTHSLTLNNGCLLCAVFFFFLLFAAASSSSSATSDSAASVGAALGDLGLREIFVHRHHYHQVAWFVGFERRVPPLCAECAPYLLYLALPRVSISLHLGIFPFRRGPMLCFPLFVFNFCFILLCFILFYSVFFRVFPALTCRFQLQFQFSVSVPVYSELFELLPLPSSPSSSSSTSCLSFFCSPRLFFVVSLLSGNFEIDFSLCLGRCLVGFEFKVLLFWV